MFAISRSDVIQVLQKFILDARRLPSKFYTDFDKRVIKGEASTSATSRWKMSVPSAGNVYELGRIGVTGNINFHKAEHSDPLNRN